MQPPTIARLAEILNGCGAAPTLEEVQAYLDPRIAEAMHVSAAVESCLREVEMRLRSTEARWQETLASLSRPWREELVEIEALGRSQILKHNTHAGEPRCDCWRGARGAYYAAVDRWAGDRTAVTEFEALWDALILLSETHRPTKDDTAAEIVAGISEVIDQQIAASLRDAAFLGRRRHRG